MHDFLRVSFLIGDRGSSTDDDRRSVYKSHLITRLPEDPAQEFLGASSSSQMRLAQCHARKFRLHASRWPPI